MCISAWEFFAYHRIIFRLMYSSFVFTVAFVGLAFRFKTAKRPPWSNLSEGGRERWTKLLLVCRTVGVHAVSRVTTLQKRVVNNNISWPLKKKAKRSELYECEEPRMIPLSLFQETYGRIILIRIDNLSSRNDGFRQSHIVNLSNWIYSWDYISQSNAKQSARALYK